jgi:hypothetical protein
VLAATLATWAATGAHAGWTLTRITEMRRGEITGIDYPACRRGLAAGLDLVAAVPAASSLTVGNPVMREHLHGPNWLDAAAFPEIVFEAVRLANVRTDGSRTEAAVTGRRAPSSRRCAWW